MNRLLERESLYTPVNPIKNRLVEVATETFAPKRLYDQHNLVAARGIMQDPQKKLIIIADHLGNDDAPALATAIKQAGYSDIAVRMVFLLGLRLVENPWTRIAIDSYAHIPVWPPTREAKTAEEQSEKQKFARATLKATRQVQSRGRILTIFPEGTRSRTQTLQKGQPEVAHYLERPNTYMLPVGLWGTEKVLPIGKWLPHRELVHVRFGKPVSLEALVKASGRNIKKMSNEEIMVLAMGKIEELLPEKYRAKCAPTESVYESQN